MVIDYIAKNLRSNTIAPCSTPFGALVKNDLIKMAKGNRRPEFLLILSKVGSRCANFIDDSLLRHVFAALPAVHGEFREAGISNNIFFTLNIIIFME